jgi:hypothetical protein
MKVVGQAMADVAIEVSEQFADTRSSEVAYQFTVTNNGNLPVKLHSVTPNIPSGAELVDVWEPLAENKLQHEELCQEMTARLAEASRAHHDWAYLVQLPPGHPNRIYYRLGIALRNIRKPEPPPLLRINDSDDALDWIQGTFPTGALQSDGGRGFADWPDAREFLQRFEAQRNRLVRLEKEREEIQASTSATLPQLDPKQSFETTYIFKFPRSFLATRRWKVAIGLTYSEVGGEGPDKYFAGKSTSRLVSGQAYTLSLIAVLASTAGLALKVGLDTSAANVESIPDLWQSMTVSGVVASAILAFIFFNIYEYTEAGRRLAIGIGWRGAVLIGALCGLVGDRVLAALQSLLGS